MKKCIIAFSFFITISCSISTSNKEIKKDNVDLNLIEFKDFNNILSFYKRNDTLFCITGNGTLFYNQEKDTWTISSININSEKIAEVENNQHFPNGYKRSAYTYYTSQHGSWSLITHANEGAECYKQEIVDTLKKTIFRFPYEMINDFFMDSLSFWVGSNFGLSKIEMKNLERTDYLQLPAYKKITSVHETTNAFYYLDFHYGLFKYEKTSQIVTPINEINKYANELNFKFYNSYLINDQLIIIGSPMDKNGYYLAGNACLFIYDLRNGNVNKIETSIKYFDSFINKNGLLIGYGEWTQSYEGGTMEHFGGVISFDYNNKQLNEITNTPIVSLNLTNEGLDAISVQETRDFTQIIYGHFKLFEGFNFPAKNISVQCDTVCLSYNNRNGDTLSNIYNKKVVVNNELFEKYSALYQTLNKQRKEAQDTILINLLFKPSMLKTRIKRIEMDKY